MHSRIFYFAACAAAQLAASEASLAIRYYNAFSWVALINPFALLYLHVFFFRNPHVNLLEPFPQFFGRFGQSVALMQQMEKKTKKKKPTRGIPAHI